jgi:hypothetical protein
MEINEFKLSALRQFGSENVSFTATIRSENQVLSPEEISAQVKQISDVIDESFKSVIEREISEKDVIIATSERRTAAVAKHDAALKEEMRIAKEAKGTMDEAKKLSDKIIREGKKA